MYIVYKQVLSVSCGGNHTCVATDLGHVYTFGAGQFGQLGLSTKVAAQVCSYFLMFG